MRNSFSSENNTRSAASRLGLTPQNKAKNGQAELLHIWAVRPGKTPGRTYTHENAAVFAPLRNMSSSPNVDRSPFGNLNRNALKSEKSRRVAGILGTWGPSASKASILGEGATGTVMSVPVEAARRALVKSTFNPIAPLPSTGLVAAKFQLVRSASDLKNFVRETQVHAVALTPKGSQLSKFVPKLYAAYYDPDARVHVTIMQMVRGETLQSIMESGGKLTGREYAELAKAFFALWNRGIFHADAHGGNIFIRRGANANSSSSSNNNGGGKIVTLIDFGQSVYIPPELRPATIAQAMDPTFQARLETYVGSLKTGQNWWNPNSRALKIAKSMVANGNATKNSAFRLNLNGVRKTNNRTLAPATANRTLANRVANRTRTNNSGTASVFSNGTGRTVVKNGNVRISISNKNNNKNANKNRSAASNKNSNSPKNSGSASKARSSPSQRAKLIKSVTKSYENMLSNFVNKSKPIAFIKTSNAGR